MDGPPLLTALHITGAVAACWRVCPTTAWTARCLIRCNSHACLLRPWNAKYELPPHLPPRKNTSGPKCLRYLRPPHRRQVEIIWPKCRAVSTHLHQSRPPPRQRPQPACLQLTRLPVKRSLVTQSTSPTSLPEAAEPIMHLSGSRPRKPSLPNASAAKKS